MSPSTRAAIVRLLRFGYTPEAMARQTGEPLEEIAALDGEVRRERRSAAAKARKPQGLPNSNRVTAERRMLLNAGYDPEIVRAVFGC